MTNTSFILFDDQTREDLLPLTFTRPVADIRIGIMTIREKWQHFLTAACSSLTVDYLRAKFPVVTAENNILINGSIVPDSVLVQQIKALLPGELLAQGALLIAANVAAGKINDFDMSNVGSLCVKEYGSEILQIRYPWDIFRLNGEAIQRDFDLLTHGRKSAAISKTNNIIKSENVFLEESARAEYVTINATAGPVYIGQDAEIMEGSVIRGPFAMCEHSAVKMAAKIYGPTSLGPHVKVGGEINNSVIFGYSNKAHDGFLGNAVIGEWCNLGADTNNSNLKNNYAEVKVWSYAKERFVNTGLQFCGLIMGDHSKCGINTMFNTGTVVGVSANIFGAGFPRNFVPSFSWGGALGYEVFSLNKAYEVATRVFGRRELEFGAIDKEILKVIFEKTAKYRNF